MKISRKAEHKLKRRSNVVAQRECDAVLGSGVVDIASLRKSHAQALAGKGKSLDDILKLKPISRTELSLRASKQFVKILTAQQKRNRALLKAATEFNAEKRASKRSKRTPTK